MSRPPPRATRTATLFPPPTLCRASPRPGGDVEQPVDVGKRRMDRLAVHHQLMVDQVGGRPRHAGALQVGGGGVQVELDGLEVALDEVGLARRREAKRSEEHTSELQSLMRNSYAVFCLKKKNP